MNTKKPVLYLILYFILLLIGAWIIVHLLAIFGVFLAIAYPVWWVVAPKQSICFICRASKEGTNCPFCHRINNAQESKAPTSLASAILNGVLIFGFTLISLASVFTESRILFTLGFPPTPRTVSFVIPSRGQYRLGEVFPLKIELSGIKTPINAVQADLGFSGEKLEVTDVSTDESFANIFVQKEVNNEGGYVRLTGGLPNPGFFSDHGTFGTVFFRSKSPGVVRVEYLPSSMILANDGRGTNVLKDYSSISYLILPERITPEEEKKQGPTSIGTKEVLGTKAKMIFYDEREVLGAKSTGKAPIVAGESLLRAFLNSLEKLDRLILEQVSRVLSPIISLFR